MIGWVSLATSIVAVVLWWGGEPVEAFYAALIALAASFATFCLAYNAPLERARLRVSQRMSRMSGKGIDTDEFQRLQSMAITPTDDDRKFRLTRLTGINLAAGVVAAGLVSWSIFNWIT